MEIKELFTPLQIGSMTIKNRVFMAPMMIGYGSDDGSISDHAATYWIERAKGGTGCLITEMMSADPKMLYSVGDRATMNFEDSKVADSYRRFTDEVHKYDCRVIPQISMPGPDATIPGALAPAPSSYNNLMGAPTEEVKTEDIPKIVENYAKTALQAKKLGFDGMQLHAAHAYMMLGSFLSPLRNRRNDQYGGCLMNRARLLIETLRAIKAEAGKDFPIIIRMSGSERLPGGNTLEDFLYMAPYLEEAGADAFEITGGTSYDLPWCTVTNMGMPHGINTPESKVIKAAVHVPVTVVGGIEDPRYAEHIIRSGCADGVVVGRALIADPEWVNKAEQGDFEDIMPCTRCSSACIQEFFAGRPVSCAINPAAGREKEFKLIPAEKKKKVVVVGGGPAGVSAAVTAARRGHDVTIFEKNDKLGGQLNLACMPPFKQELSNWMVYYNTQVRKLGIRVKTGVEVTEEILDAEKPDQIVVATGAHYATPPFPGVDGDHVYQAWDVISNRKPIIAGNVVVIGGGSVGLETAELLVRDARGPIHVTVVEMLPDVGSDLFLFNKKQILKRIADAGIKVMPGTKVCSIDKDRVNCERNGKACSIEGVTNVVLAVGSKSENSLYQKIKEKYPDAILVGDAKKVGRAMHAIESGTRAGMSI